jgi:hypothetical protein
MENSELVGDIRKEGIILKGNVKEQGVTVWI